MLRVIRFALAMIAVSLAAGSGSADEKPKPHALTAKEAADGWLMLFDGETTFGWKTEGGVQLDKGVLVIGGANGGAITSTTPFGRGEVKFRARTVEGQLNGRLTWRGGEQVIAKNAEATTTQWEPGEPGVGPLRFEAPAGTTVRVDSILFLPKEAKPLFNGKDLSGWKVFSDPKRSASKWEVTKDGEIHVSNGPGDLQTEGKYGDFVLQFECKTNGAGLNSGIFFRCIPDQYQNGYEAQINNATVDGDRTKPKDAGTGAIYRRIPARKVVANDKEWFTMTVVAHGKHISTWVNGYQTVDWTDDRPADENPRKGARTAAGHLSIQGHDPTTDILFRNLRIAELK